MTMAWFRSDESCQLIQCVGVEKAHVAHPLGDRDRSVLRDLQKRWRGGNSIQGRCSVGLPGSDPPASAFGATWTNTAHGGKQAPAVRAEFREGISGRQFMDRYSRFELQNGHAAATRHGADRKVSASSVGGNVKNLGADSCLPEEPDSVCLKCEDAQTLLARVLPGRIHQAKPAPGRPHPRHPHAASILIQPDQWLRLSELQVGGKLASGRLNEQRSARQAVGALNQDPFPRGPPQDQVSSRAGGNLLGRGQVP